MSSIESLSGSFIDPNESLPDFEATREILAEVRMSANAGMPGEVAVVDPKRIAFLESEAKRLAMRANGIVEQQFDN